MVGSQGFALNAPRKGEGQGSQALGGRDPPQGLEEATGPSCTGTRGQTTLSNGCAETNTDRNPALRGPGEHTRREQAKPEGMQAAPCPAAGTVPQVRRSPAFRSTAGLSCLLLLRTQQAPPRRCPPRPPPRGQNPGALSSRQAHSAWSPPPPTAGLGDTACPP